jgi:O-Antigen ligase
LNDAAKARRHLAGRAIAGAGLVVLAILSPFLPLLIVFAGTLPAGAPHVSMIGVQALAVATGLCIAACAGGLALGGIAKFPKALVLPLAGLVASQMLALVMAVDSAAGAFGVACTLAGILILLAAVETLDDERLRRLYLGCYFFSAIVAIAIAVFLSASRLPPAMYAYEHGRASGTFLQPNEFAGYLLFVIPLGLAQLPSPRWLRIVGLCAAAAGCAGLLLSVSRAAILSLAVGLVALIRYLGPRVLVAYALVALVCLIAFVTVFRDVAHDPSENASRLAVWGGSLRMAERFVLTGVGPFNFHLAYPAFKLPDAAADEIHAHDLPLHLLIEDGVLGLAAFVWFVVAAVREAGRVGRTIPPGDRQRVLLFWALTSAFIATALHNVVDVVTTFLLVVSWPMLGLLLSLRSQVTPT